MVVGRRAAKMAVRTARPATAAKITNHAVETERELTVASSNREFARSLRICRPSKTKVDKVRHKRVVPGQAGFVALEDLRTKATTDMPIGINPGEQKNRRRQHPTEAPQQLGAKFGF